MVHTAFYSDGGETEIADVGEEAGTLVTLCGGEGEGDHAPRREAEGEKEKKAGRSGEGDSIDDGRSIGYFKSRRKEATRGLAATCLI